MGDKTGFFVSESNVVDMQFYRLRKAISQAKDPIQLVTLAELAMAYVDGQVGIKMQSGEMKFYAVPNAACPAEPEDLPIDDDPKRAA